MLLWRPKFYQERSYFPGNLLFSEFQWILMSTCWVIVNLVTHRSTCKPCDITILIIIVVCSEPILIVVFRFFKCWYLWNQIRYQETVDGVHSCFSCTFIRENKNFHFISTLRLIDQLLHDLLRKECPAAFWHHVQIVIGYCGWGTSQILFLVYP